MPRTYGTKPVPSRVGMLAVLRENGRAQSGDALWLCRCDCGAEKSVTGAALRSGRTKSCGCDQARKWVTHGLTRRCARPPSEYNTWTALRSRCEDPGDPKFPRYGLRGIKVCERWSTFANFLADMGQRPSPGHSIDRINNDGNYEPANCRWATQQEQQNNRSTNHMLTVDGATKTASDWSRVTGISANTILRRIGLGWSPEEALKAPLRRQGWTGERP